MGTQYTTLGTTSLAVRTRVVRSPRTTNIAIGGCGWLVVGSTLQPITENTIRRLTFGLRSAVRSRHGFSGRSFFRFLQLDAGKIVGADEAQRLMVFQRICGGCCGDGRSGAGKRAALFVAGQRQGRRRWSAGRALVVGGRVVGERDRRRGRGRGRG